MSSKSSSSLVTSSLEFFLGFLVIFFSDPSFILATSEDDSTVSGAWTSSFSIFWNENLLAATGLVEGS